MPKGHPVYNVSRTRALAHIFKVQDGRCSRVLLSAIEGESEELSGETRRRISLLDQSDFPNIDDLKRAVAVCTCIKTSWPLFPPILILSVSISLIILTGRYIFYFQGYSTASSFKSSQRQTCITQPRHLHLLSSPSSLASMPRLSQPASLFAAHPLHPALAGIPLE